MLTEKYVLFKVDVENSPKICDVLKPCEVP